MFGSGREVLPDVRDWAKGPFRRPGVIGSPSRMFGTGRMALQMSGSGREALPDVREWTGCPPGCPGVEGKPTRFFGSDR